MSCSLLTGLAVLQMSVIESLGFGVRQIQTFLALLLTIWRKLAALSESPFHLLQTELITATRESS